MAKLSVWREKQMVRLVNRMTERQTDGHLWRQTDSQVDRGSDSRIKTMYILFHLDILNGRERKEKITGNSRL